MAKPTKTQNSAKTAAKKRIVKVDAAGEVRISATFNNIIISFTNKTGQVISWSSAGKMGFKGSKKNTPYAAQMAAADAAKAAADAKMLAAKLAAAKKSTITCVKGKVVKKVTGIKPKAGNPIANAPIADLRAYTAGKLANARAHSGALAEPEMRKFTPINPSVLPPPRMGPNSGIFENRLLTP